MAVQWGRVSKLMMQPQRHPKTGVFRLRKGVPQALRRRVAAVMGRDGEVREIIRSLGTHDPKEATQRMPEACQWANDILEAARLGALPLAHKDAHALAGRWYQERLAEWEANPALAAEWDGWEEGDPSPSHLAEENEESDGPVWQSRWAAFIRPFIGHADSLLAAAGVVTDAPGKRLLAELLIKRLGQARTVHHQRQRGDYSPDTRAATFPALEGARKASSATAAPKAPTASLTGLLAKWKTLTTNKPRTVAEAEYAIAALVTFIGHDDAMQICPADLMRWRDAQKEDGKTNNTWNNRLSLVRQVFAHGVSDQILTSDPTAGLRLRRSKVQSPLSYTDEDALQLLTRARKETRPSLRWAHWVMAFTGMRAGEVLQMTGGDVRCDNGTWYLAVHEDGPGRSIKTGGPRNVPIHDALIAEGFVRYAQTIGADASLFPDKKPDKHGNRGGRAWNVIGKWARTTGGITDPRKAPDHSWRHRIIEEMRNTRGVPEDARNAIVGHTTKSMDKQYGARGENLRRLSLELNKVKLPCPPPATTPHKAP